MQRKDTVWKSGALGRQYLEGVRGAIPLAEAQIELVLFLMRQWVPRVRSFLDLGCGDGVLGRALLASYPEATGVFLDFSDTMIAAARAKLSMTPATAVLIAQDYGTAAWVQAVTAHGPYDAIVSGFSIHHQPHERKRELYREIFDLLSPGGVFLNLEHVASMSAGVQEVFDEYFVEALCQHHSRLGGTKTRSEVAQEYYHRPDKAANILAPVEEQCGWLRGVGFCDVDCYFKVFELALFGGRRP